MGVYVGQCVWVSDGRRLEFIPGKENSLCEGAKCETALTVWGQQVFDVDGEQGSPCLQRQSSALSQAGRDCMLGRAGVSGKPGPGGRAGMSFARGPQYAAEHKG